MCYATTACHCSGLVVNASLTGDEDGDDRDENAGQIYLLIVHRAWKDKSTSMQHQRSRNGALMYDHHTPNGHESLWAWP